MKKRLFALLLCAATIAGLASCGKKDDTPNDTKSSTSSSTTDSALPAGYPSKDINIILPYGAGSSQEAILRTACAYVEDKYDLPKNFVITNKEGASGEIGLTEAFYAEHDGYTLAMFHSPHLTLDIVRGDECAFKYTDFEPICNFMIDPTCWYVNGANKDTYPDFQSLIDAALAAPGTISVACGGLNTSEGRFIQQVQRETGAEFKIVPIDNDAEFVSMLMGKHVDALVCQLGDVLTHVEEGDFFPLLVGTSERDSKIPDVPTTTELGYTMESYSMRSLAALTGTPNDVYQFLVEAFAEAMASDEVTSKCKELGVDLTLLTPEEIQTKWDEIHAATLKEWESNPWQ